MTPISFHAESAEKLRSKFPISVFSAPLRSLRETIFANVIVSVAKNQQPSLKDMPAQSFYTFFLCAFAPS